MELILLLALVCLVLASLYYYLSWNYNFWQEQGIPYDKNIIPGIGNILSVVLLRQNLASLCEKYYKNTKHSMFGFYQLTTPTLLVRDPELVKNILLTNFANFANNQMQISSPKKDALLTYNPFFSTTDTWKDNRVAISNAFSSKKLKTMLSFIQDVTSNMESYLKEKLSLHNGKYEIELKHLFNLYTGEIATTGIGIKGHDFREDNSSQDQWLPKRILEEIFAAPAIGGGIIQVIFTHIHRLAKLMDISIITKRVDNYYRHAISNILSYRKRENITSNDFLQIVADYVRSHMTGIDEESALAAYSLSFTVELYETSAVTLSFTVFQIAAHPQVQEKARKEVEKVLEKHNGKFDYESLKELTYLDQILDESLRMNHITGIMMKICTNETHLTGSDGLSCTMKPGNVAVISNYGLQMDPNYWPDPEKFDPDRFSEEQKTERPKFAFLPFGEGPRICVGMRMAVMMIKLAIATILKDFSLELSSKTPFPLVRNEAKFLSAFDKGFWIVLKPLTHTSP